jgi:hypothetical protein
MILTNAHCWEEGSDLGIGILGTLLRTERQPQFPVVARVPHPNYAREPFFSNDVALVKLEGVPPDAFRPIQLNFDPEIPAQAGDELVILGWGSVTNGEDAPLQPSNELLEATTQYVPFETCAVAEDPETGAKYGNSVTNTGVGPDWLCTQDPVGATCKGKNPTAVNIREEDHTSIHLFIHPIIHPVVSLIIHLLFVLVCFGNLGDSGGPVIRAGVNPRSDLLVGVISGASGGCDNQYLPQINQRVSWHRDWIVSTVCELSEYPPAEFGCPGSETTPPVTAPPTTTAPVPVPTNLPTTAPVPVPTTDSPTTAPPIPVPSLFPSATPTAPSETTLEPTPTVAPSMTNETTPVPTGSSDETLAPVEGVPLPDDPREDETTAAPVSAVVGSPTASPAPTSTPAPTNTKVTVYIKIIFDDKPQHIGWMIADENYGRFRVAVPIGAYIPGDEVVNDQVDVEGGERYML